VHHNLAEIVTQSTSQPSSPRSSALPSPPDSPDSVSSFPSVSSSFFFSSAAASPPHPHAHLDHIRDPTQGLIIPSLTLPAALRRPTLFGQTVGDIKLLVLASKAAGKGFLSGLLVEDNEDVVEVGIWEEAEYGSVLRASTDWIEHRDAHGLENFEPSRNLEIIELPGYDTGDDVCPCFSLDFQYLATNRGAHDLASRTNTIADFCHPDPILLDLRSPPP
jgi:hypothetical protein